MAFDLQQWRETIRQRIHEFAQDPQGGTAGSLFGFLCGMTLFPLAEAIGRGDMMEVGMTLGGIAAGVGGNLVAEQVQRWADRTEEEVTAELDQAIVESAELRQALDAILGELEVLGETRQALSEDDRDWFTVTLDEELARFGTELRQARIVVGDWVRGDKVVGDKVMGDKITIVVGAEEKPEALLDPAQAKHIYLTHVIDRYQHLQLQGIRSAGELVSIDLEEIYITLNAVQKRTMPEEEMEEMLARLGQRVPGAGHC